MSLYPLLVASPVAEHRLRTRRLSGHGPRAQPLHSMWDLPGPGHEPVSPASAGRLSTTAPPGKPLRAYYVPNSVLDVCDIPMNETKISFLLLLTFQQGDIDDNLFLTGGPGKRVVSI